MKHDTMFVYEFFIVVAHENYYYTFTCIMCISKGCTKIMTRTDKLIIYIYDEMLVQVLLTAAIFKFG